MILAQFAALGLVFCQLTRQFSSRHLHLRRPRAQLLQSTYTNFTSITGTAFNWRVPPAALSFMNLVRVSTQCPLGLKETVAVAHQANGQHWGWVWRLVEFLVDIEEGLLPKLCPARMPSTVSP